MAIHAFMLWPARPDNGAVDAVAKVREGGWLGLDLGGTNLKWTVLDTSGGKFRVVAREQTATAVGGPEQVVAQLEAVARSASRRLGPLAGAGVGLPGRYDAVSGTALFLPNLAGDWAGVEVAGRVAEAAGAPCALINDARAFTLAEHRLGAGRGAPNLLGVTLGTGVGGGLVLAGHLHLGRDGSAGEWGHQTLFPRGRLCGCGNRGCLETVANASALARYSGAVSAEEAVARARAGDRQARAAVARVGRHLGLGAANLVVSLGLEMIVVGGGVAAAGRLLLAPMEAEVRRRVRMTDVSDLVVAEAELGVWAGAIGAAIHGAESAVRAGGGNW